MMRYRLRTLLIVLALGPVLIPTAIWWTELLLEALDIYRFRPWLMPWE